MEADIIDPWSAALALGGPGLRFYRVVLTLGVRRLKQSQNSSTTTRNCARSLANPADYTLYFLCAKIGLCGWAAKASLPRRVLS